MITKTPQLLLIASLAVVLAACENVGSESNDDAVTTAPITQQSAVSSAPASSGSSSTSSASSTTTTSSSTSATTSTGGKVSTSWSIPTAREDGSPLTPSEIQGYEIYFYKNGTPQNQGTVISIGDPAATSYTTGTLTAGTYYFAISAIDTNGVYSQMSNYVSVTVL